MTASMSQPTPSMTAIGPLGWSEAGNHRCCFTASSASTRTRRRGRRAISAICASRSTRWSARLGCEIEMKGRRECTGLRRCPHRHDDGGKNEVVVVFVLTRFGEADTSSEIRGLELRPEPMPRAFPFWGEGQPPFQPSARYSDFHNCQLGNLFLRHRSIQLSCRRPS